VERGLGLNMFKDCYKKQKKNVQNKDKDPQEEPFASTSTFQI